MRPRYTRNEVALDDADRRQRRLCVFYRLDQTFICLIRPDGHVGLILNPSTAPGVEEICQESATRRRFGPLSRELQTVAASAFCFCAAPFR